MKLSYYEYLIIWLIDYYLIINYYFISNYHFIIYYYFTIYYYSIRLETKSCRILPLTYRTKYDMT